MGQEEKEKNRGGILTSCGSGIQEYTNKEVQLKVADKSLLSLLQGAKARGFHCSGVPEKQKSATALQGCRSNAIGKGFLSPPQ
jgi:hypothetical protein